MSSYKIESLAPKYKVEVGFDAASNSSYWTYFAQVIDLQVEERLNDVGSLSANEADELEENLVILWIGNDYLKPVRSIPELQRLLADHAVIPESIVRQLEEDIAAQREKYPFTDLLDSLRDNIRVGEWIYCDSLEE